MSLRWPKEFWKNSRKNGPLLLKIEESVRLRGQGRAVVERAKISSVSTHKNKTIEGEPATYPKVAFKNRPSSEEDPYIFLTLFPSFSSLPFCRKDSSKLNFFTICLHPFFFFYATNGPLNFEKLFIDIFFIWKRVGKGWAK